MKILFGVVLLSSAALFLGGCATQHAEPAYHAGDEIPPDFMFGPVASVLTNLNGFSAHVTSTVTSPEGAQTAAGELLGRDGRLIFQPTVVVTNKSDYVNSPLFFIWDEGQHSGYVLSEALQAYAPFKSDVDPAGQLSITDKGLRQDVNGRPCHQYDALAKFDNGIKAHVTLWRTEDATRFPVRIEAANAPSRMQLDFSEVRLESPPKELFLPPDGFTAYPNSSALINELIVREASRGRKLDIKAVGDHGPNWHAMPDPAQLAHP